MSGFKNHFLAGMIETYLALISAQIVSNLACVIYITKYLKINDHVQRILATQAVLSLISSILSMLGYILAAFLEIENTLSCGLFNDLQAMILIINFILTMGLSIMRYYMAMKVGSNKVIDENLIKKRFFLGFGTLLIVVMIMLIGSLLFGYHISRAAFTCESRDFDSVQLIRIVTGLGYFVPNVITFYFDLQLIYFIKRYNKNTTGILKTWSFAAKTGNKEKLENLIKNTTPVLSSILSFGMFVILIIVAVFSHKQFSFQLNFVVISVLNVLFLPITLILSVRNQKRTKIHNWQAPTGLFFHDDQSVENTFDNSSEEMSKDKIQSFNEHKNCITQTKASAPIVLQELQDVTKIEV